jgi:hypothetical protein
MVQLLGKLPLALSQCLLLEQQVREIPEFQAVLVIQDQLAAMVTLVIQVLTDKLGLAAQEDLVVVVVTPVQLEILEILETLVTAAAVEAVEAALHLLILQLPVLQSVLM